MQNLNTDRVSRTGVIRSQLGPGGKKAAKKAAAAEKFVFRKSISSPFFATALLRVGALPRLASSPAVDFFERVRTKYLFAGVKLHAYACLLELVVGRCSGPG